MLDSDGYVSEGSSVNIFIVKDGVLYTPELGAILSGITRNFVMQLARDLQLHVIEKKITTAELYNADEAFFVGTAAEVTAIRSVNDKIIGQENLYPIAEQIKQQYIQTVHGELEQ